MVARFVSLGDNLGGVEIKIWVHTCISSVALFLRIWLGGECQDSSS